MVVLNIGGYFLEGCKENAAILIAEKILSFHLIV